MKYSESLKKTKDFQNVYRRGKSYANRYLVMYVLSNQTEGNRLGISVSKKVGNSVIRHHLTRLIRESYRLHEDMFNSGLDIVVVARSTAKDISYHEVESALLHLGGLHKIISKEKKMESFSDENDQVSVLSNLFVVRAGSCRKIRSHQGRHAGFMENYKMQSFFKRWI